MQVLEKSKELLLYTLTVCTNEKVFPKSKRWVITQKITNECVEAISCIRRANSVYAQTEADWKYRRAQQVEAHSRIGALYTLIDIAFVLLNIESKRIKFWTELLRDTDNLLKAWMKSDKERMKKIK